MLNQNDKEEIESIILDAENNPPPQVEVLTGKALAQAFMQSRLNNAKGVESAKSKAIDALVQKIDANTRPETLIRIIETLDNCTSKDMEILAEMSRTKDGSGLLSIEAEKSRAQSVDTSDQTLKMLHNVLHALKVMKNESTESGGSA